MADRSPPVSVVIVDDHAMFRSGVRSELGDAVEVVAEAADVDEAVAAIAAHHPDVVLLDVHLPPVDPRLQVGEPRAHLGEEDEDARQDQGDDEVAHDRCRGVAQHDTEREADGHADQVAQDDLRRGCQGDVPDRVDAHDRGPEQVADGADGERDGHRDDPDHERRERLGPDDAAAARHERERREPAALAPLTGDAQDRDHRQDHRHREADRRAKFS
jgi:hypothetical protein